MVKPLPPLNAVRAFEAAARHLNLSRAAEELGVTQGAISKQVIGLEDFIGVQLFIRDPGGLQLTSEGGNLKEAITPAFTSLSEAFARYSRRPPRSNTVRIATVASFASQFLVPKLSAFSKTFPGIDLEFVTSTRLVDLAREEFDLAVRYGPGTWEGVIAVPLTEGHLLPVCSTEVFNRAGGDLDALLAGNRRIQCSAYNEWRDFCEVGNVDLAKTSPTYMIEEFTVALTAAVLGEGLTLLPDVLCQHRIKRGDLVQFAPVRVKTDYAFYLVYSPNATRRAIVNDVIAWLKDEAADADHSG
ncbi:MAG TPA: LysR substrate-binding domain-containing protein [Hyphomonadaceae bacterium]|nr:LysR substrate-binding domain-containing protein [Hyphomonadaceae bacterium]